jgi:5-methylcytosine-specific restriction endonuclease McrA
MVREIVASQTGWRQSPEPPDPERKPVFITKSRAESQSALQGSEVLGQEEAEHVVSYSYPERSISSMEVGITSDHLS